MVLQRFRAGRMGYRSQTLVALRATSIVHVNVRPVSRPDVRRVLEREVVVRQPAGREAAMHTSAIAPPAPIQAVSSPTYITRQESRSQHYHAPAVTFVSGLALGASRQASAAAIGSIASRAVRHFQHLDEFVRTFRKKVLAPADAQWTTQRILHQNVRREEPRPSTPMVLRPAQPAAPGASHAPLPEPPRPERPVNPAPPAINIESLATQVMDQIDRRVVAWRERMGKF
jgi:hypothetical protein